jgi:hypothetical protein
VQGHDVLYLALITAGVRRAPTGDRALYRCCVLYPQNVVRYQHTRLRHCCIVRPACLPSRAVCWVIGSREQVLRWCLRRLRESSTRRPRKGTASAPYFRTANHSRQRACLFAAYVLVATRDQLAISHGIHSRRPSAGIIGDSKLTGAARGRDTKAEWGCRSGRIAALGCAMAMVNVGPSCNLCRAQKVHKHEAARVRTWRACKADLSYR